MTLKRLFLSAVFMAGVMAVPGTACTMNMAQVAAPAAAAEEMPCHRAAAPQKQAPAQCPAAMFCCITDVLPLFSVPSSVPAPDSVFVSLPVSATPVLEVPAVRHSDPASDPPLQSSPADQHPLSLRAPPSLA